MTWKELQQGPFSSAASSAPAFQALVVPRVVILSLQPSREEIESEALQL